MFLIGINGESIEFFRHYLQLQLSICFLGADPSLKDVILKGGGWFVQAIFL